MSTSLRSVSSALIAVLVLVAASGASAQVSTLTQSSGFSAVRSNGGLLADTYDAGSSNLDRTKLSGLNGSASYVDLVGNSSFALLQVGINATDTYFRVRLSDYKASASGSVFVLAKSGSSIFGIGAVFGTPSNGATDGTYYLTPSGTANLTQAFAYNTPTLLQNSSYFNYSSVTTIDGTNSLISANDAYVTFRILNSDLTAKNAAFSITTNTTFSVFTNTSSTLGTSITGDYVSFTGTGLTTDPLTFGTVPEPATWMSSGAMFAVAGFVWWRRRRGNKLA